jgi:NAD kinase
MNISDIVIVPKNSKYERDKKHYVLTHEEMMNQYVAERVDAEGIFESHKRQKKSLAELKRFFYEKQFVPWEKITKEIAARAPLVISLGGDNHFQYVSHFVNSGLILGVNSDPVKSEGVLTYFKAEDFEELVERLERDDYQVEEWTRLEVRINGTFVGLVTSECYLGEEKRKKMSKHIIRLNGQEEEQKNSGLLVFPGAGSTGWHDSECRYLYPEGNVFPKTADYARFLATAPYRGKLCGCSMLEGKILPGEELFVKSLNNDRGIVGIDSVEEYNFMRGTEAVIRISDESLNVVK